MIKENIDLKKYTTFKVGGGARYFARVKREEEIPTLVDWACKRRVPVFVLGGGSNIVFSDKGFNGLVIKMDNSDIASENPDIYRAGAGVSLRNLLGYCAEKGASGMEWTAGIPGTLGGAIRGNAKALGNSMAQFIVDARYFDMKKRSFGKLSNKECEFGEKTSVFKKNKNFIITSASLRLTKDKKTKIKERVEKNLAYRKNNHPVGASAGCMFINPKRGPSAAFLIEQSGFKGRKIGGAEVSPIHANFIMNVGGASSEDVLNLAGKIKEKVQKNFGVTLKEEPDMEI